MIWVFNIFLSEPSGAAKVDAEISRVDKTKVAAIRLKIFFPSNPMAPLKSPLFNTILSNLVSRKDPADYMSPERASRTEAL